MTGLRIGSLGIATFGAAVALLVSSPVQATEGSPARKLGRGLAAMTCGFLEVPGHIVKTTRERGEAWGFTLGLVQGLAGIVSRELVGVYEFLSAPFEVPAGYVPILEPEFPWDYFDEPDRPARPARR